MVRVDQALAALPRRTRETLGDRFGALETSARAARSSSHGGRVFGTLALFTAMGPTAVAASDALATASTIISGVGDGQQPEGPGESDA